MCFVVGNSYLETTLKIAKLLRVPDLCSVVFHAFTLKLPIQTSLSVALELPVSSRSSEKCENFRNTSTPQGDIILSDFVCVILHIISRSTTKGINTPSVKQQHQHQRQQQGPAGIHCDASKWVPDPLPSVMASGKTSKLPLTLDA